jgi:hypothetical protein
LQSEQRQTSSQIQPSFPPMGEQIQQTQQITATKTTRSFIRHIDININKYNI